MVIRKTTNMLYVYLTMMLITLSNVVLIFADDDGILSATDNGTKTIIDRAIVWVDTTLLPILLVALFISLVICCKNEKALPIIKQGFKILVLGALGVNAIWLILRTILWVANVITNAGGSTNTFTQITNMVNTYMI